MFKYTYHASNVGHELIDGQRLTVAICYLCIASANYWHVYVHFVLGIQEQYTRLRYDIISVGKPVR